MRKQYALMWCDTCGRVTHGARPGIDYRYQLLFCVATAGLWLLVWLVTALRNRSLPYACCYCGSSGNAIDPPNREVIGVLLGLVAMFLMLVLMLLLTRRHPDHHRHMTARDRPASVVVSGTEDCRCDPVWLVLIHARRT